MKYNYFDVTLAPLKWHVQNELRFFLLSNLLFLLYSQLSKWYHSNIALTRRLGGILSSSLFETVYALCLEFSLYLVCLSTSSFFKTQIKLCFLEQTFSDPFFSPGRIKYVSSSLLLCPVHTPIPSVTTLSGNSWLMYLPF